MQSDPGFVSLGAFRIVGIERFTSNGPQTIHEAWQELERRASEVRHQRVPEVR